MLVVSKSTARARTRKGLGLHRPRVYGHARDGIYAHVVEFGNLVRGLDATGDNELLGRAGAKDRSNFDGEAAHGAFGVDMGIEKGGAGVFEPGNGLFRREVHGFLPTLHGDFAVLRIDGEDELLFAKLLLEILGKRKVEDGVALAIGLVVSTEERRTIDYALRTEVEETLAILGGLETSTDLARELVGEARDERGVRTLAHGGVEVDELHERIFAEAFDPVIEVVKGELELFALDELDDLAVH